jgi:transposase InsO family protein
MIFGGSGIIDGTESEPYRKEGLARDRRAGSVPPSVIERTTTEELTDEQRKEWRLWKKSELKVRGILLATVSEGMSDDLEDLNTAKEIWDKLAKRHKQDTPEEKARIQTNLVTLRLPENPTVEEMETHLNEFNVLIRQARVAGLEYTEGMKVQQLLITLPQSMNVIHHAFRTMDDWKKTWDELTKQYNLCIEDARTWTKRNGAIKKESGSALFVKEKKKQNKTNQYKDKDKGNSRLMKDKKKGECFTCNKPGHWSKDCWHNEENKKKGLGFKSKKDQHKNKNKSEDSNDGDAMTAEAEEVPWSLTTIGHDETSTWKWDEEYGMSSDDDVSSPKKAQKSQPPGWSDSCGRLPDLATLSSKRSVDDDNRSRTELTQPNKQDPSGSMARFTVRSNAPEGVGSYLQMTSDIHSGPLNNDPMPKHNRIDRKRSALLCKHRTVVGRDKENDARPLTVKDMVSWVIDSGATHHMTWQRDILINVIPNARPLVFNTAGDYRLEAKERGTVVVRLKNGQTLKINDVHYVPASRINLLSTHNMVERGWDVRLQPKGGHIKKGNVSLTLTRDGGLWRTSHRRGATSGVEGGFNNHRLHTPAEEDLSPLGKEHKRLGHVGRYKLLELAKEGELTGWNADNVMNDPFKITDCATCQQFKMTRHPKSKHSPRGSRDAELIHVDITGPFTPSLTGNDHLLVMMDDHSKVCALVPMVGKRPSFEALKVFVAKIERQLGEKVRFVRSDNGMEFDKNEAQQWYQQQGIIHQLSTVYTPELNGTIERFMRTTKEMIASMIDDSKLGHLYWDHAARYTAVILMKTSKSEDGGNPWRKLTGREPNIASVLRFGSMCFIHVPKETRTKASFENNKAVPGRILGQDEAVSGWIVMRESDGKVIHSRDVRLATGETITPLTTRTSNTSPTHINIDDVLREEEEEPTEPATTNDPPEDVIDTDITNAEQRTSPPPRPSTIPRAAPRTKPGWDMVPVIEREETTIPTATIDEQGRRRNAPRITRTQQPARHADSFLTYNGPNARNAHLASEVVGWSLVTGFDKDEPRNVREAMSGEDAAKWQEAMNKELKNLREKQTWQEVLTPVNRKKIGAKWVLKIKRDAEGDIIKYKARLVAKGYSQVPGVDFEETYAPVGRTTSLRILLTIAATQDLEILQADVEGAYLNGNLDVDIYMEYPEGVKPKKGCDGLLLKKSLYGLKQSGRTWWIEMGTKLAKLGFKRLESDWGLYTRPRNQKDGLIIILVYVDDFIIAGDSKREINSLLDKLKSFWKLSEMGEVSTILGMKVTRDRKARKIWITQPAYVDRLLERFPEHSKYRNWAAPIGQTAIVNDEPAALTPYQEIVGCLQWLAGCTRPDISYTASMLARYSNSPTEAHWEMALRATSYLARTREKGLELGGRQQSPLEGWVDADWAGCRDTRRSTTGYVFKINGSAITWCSRRQQTVASSTVEAEYIATAEAAREAIWLRNLLKELGFKSLSSTLLHVDNQGALRLALNPSTHQRTKHIDIKHHLIRELVESGTIDLEYVPTQKQEADILTKALPGPQHWVISLRLGLRPPPARGGVLLLEQQWKSQSKSHGTMDRRPNLGTRLRHGAMRQKGLWTLL